MLFYMKMNKLDKNKLKLTINTRIKTKKKNETNQNEFKLLVNFTYWHLSHLVDQNRTTKLIRYNFS